MRAHNGPGPERERKEGVKSAANQGERDDAWARLNCLRLEVHVITEFCCVSVRFWAWNKCSTGLEGGSPLVHIYIYIYMVDLMHCYLGEIAADIA